MAPNVQEEIIATLQSQHDGVSMIDLLKKMQTSKAQSTTDIRAAVLALLSVQRVVLTPQRKLRLSS